MSKITQTAAKGSFEKLPKCPVSRLDFAEKGSQVVTLTNVTISFVKSNGDGALGWRLYGVELEDGQPLTRFGVIDTCGHKDVPFVITGGMYLANSRPDGQPVDAQKPAAAEQI